MGRPDRDVLVASDQLLVGHDLAIPRADDQLGIFQWTALHLVTVADTPCPGWVPRLSRLDGHAALPAALLAHAPAGALAPVLAAAFA